METLFTEYIDKIPLFAGIDYYDLALFMNKCRIKELKTGEFIYKSGEYGDDCGIIISGTMSVEFREGAVSDKAEKNVLLQQGDIYGEIAVLSGYARTADVTVAEPAKVLLIPKAILLKLFDKFDTVKSRDEHRRKNKREKHNGP